MFLHNCWRDENRILRPNEIIDLTRNTAGRDEGSRGKCKSDILFSHLNPLVFIIIIIVIVIVIVIIVLRKKIPPFVTVFFPSSDSATSVQTPLLFSRYTWVGHIFICPQVSNEQQSWQYHRVFSKEVKNPLPSPSQKCNTDILFGQLLEVCM